MEKKAVIVSSSRNTVRIKELSKKLKILGFSTNENNLLYQMKEDGCLYPKAASIAQIVDGILNLSKINGDVVLYDKDLSTDQTVQKAIVTLAGALHIPILSVTDVDSKIVNKAIKDWEDQNAETQIQIPGSDDGRGQVGSSEMDGGDSSQGQSGSNEAASGNQSRDVSST